MAGITLDAGALIALDRGAADLTTFVGLALSQARSMVVPAPVVAQAWRGATNVRMKRLLDRIAIEEMTVPLAFRIGELLRVSRTADVVDAMLVLTASARGDDILTDDVRDIALLNGFVDNPSPIITIQSLSRR